MQRDTPAKIAAVFTCREDNFMLFLMTNIRRWMPIEPLGRGAGTTACHVRWAIVARSFSQYAQTCRWTVMHLPQSAIQLEQDFPCPDPSEFPSQPVSDRRMRLMELSLFLQFMINAVANRKRSAH
jgi:hypothetical protein